MKPKITSFNRFEISLTKPDYESATIPGCDAQPQIKTILYKPYIKRQFAVIAPQKIAAELKEYGAWDETELKDTVMNQYRIIWIAAGNIIDGD